MTESWWSDGTCTSERMIDAYGPTDDCGNCSSRRGAHSAGCRQRFGSIQCGSLQKKRSQSPLAFARETLVDETVTKLVSDALSDARCDKDRRE